MTRDEMIAAGKWLDEARSKRGLSVRQFATALDVSTQVVYKWQKGDNSVSDESAAKIAQVLGMDEIDVRRHLGLWVPDTEHSDQTSASEPSFEEMRDKLASDPFLTDQEKETFDAFVRLVESLKRTAEQRRTERRKPGRQDEESA